MSSLSLSHSLSRRLTVSMRNGKKRARSAPGSTKQPRNKYSDNPPDFANLASLYPSFKPFVFFSNGRARIDWTDYNATRELTRILLLHDHGVNWYVSIEHRNLIDSVCVYLRASLLYIGGFLMDSFALLFLIDRITFIGSMIFCPLRSFRVWVVMEAK